MVRDSLSFDELAAWYTQEGYKVAPWLELLDLNKWAVGAAASSAANGERSRASCVVFVPVGYGGNGGGDDGV